MLLSEQIAETRSCRALDEGHVPAARSDPALTVLSNEGCDTMPSQICTMSAQEYMFLILATC